MLYLAHMFEKNENPNYQSSLLRAFESPESAANAAYLSIKIQSGVDIVPLMIKAWKMPDLRNRDRLMSAVGGIFDERLVPIILDGLQYPDSGVLKSAEYAFERYRQLRSWEQSAKAWQRAGKIGSPADALIRKLESEKFEVRIAAIESLGTMGAAEALPFLVELMEDKNAKIAAAAAAAVKKINSVGGKSEEG